MHDAQGASHELVLCRNTNKFTKTLLTFPDDISWTDRQQKRVVWPDKPKFWNFCQINKG